jgi:hypothetical protein
MGESHNPMPSFGSASDKREESRPPVIPIAVGAIAVLVMIGMIMLFSRGNSKSAAVPVAADPYAASLPISDVAMSTADNFAGQQVTYIEGKVTNKGSNTINGAVLQVVFHDTLGQIVQKENQRLMIITTREPYIDTAPLSSAPLKPSQTREFRLTFEHVSGDWNMQVPEVSILKTSTE